MCPPHNNKSKLKTVQNKKISGDDTSGSSAVSRTIQVSMFFFAAYNEFNIYREKKHTLLLLIIRPKQHKMNKHVY